MANDINPQKIRKLVLSVREALKEADTDEERTEVFNRVREGPNGENVLQRLLDHSYFKARDKQLDVLRSTADTTVVLCGRGWGKNWTGAHWAIEKSKEVDSLAIIGETASDVRDFMVNGPSGILTLSPDYRKPEYLPSKRQLRWEDGTVCNLYSGESVDSLRGLSTSHIWCDELAKYRYIEDAVEQIDYTLREGDNQQLLITTTPRPHPVIKEYKEKAETTDYVELIRGSSFENPELGDRFQRKLQAAKDTRLGRQEIFGEILDDSVGELWSYSDISTVDPEEVPKLKRIIVGLDPSISDDEGDEAGIVVVGEGTDEVAYVLADLSGQYTTTQWAAVVVAAYRGSLSSVKDLCDSTGHKRLQEVAHMEYPYPPADKIHAERNQGGSLVEQQLRTLDARIPYDSTHTTRSKDVRAEPVHSLYQAGKVKHVGQLPDLEDQLVEFMRDGRSPDRVDAMVYAVNKLLLVEKQSRKDAFSKILNSF